MTPVGTLTVLHEFLRTSDGGQPSGALIQATDGNLYGTTQIGGANDAGVVFRYRLSSPPIVVTGSANGIGPASGTLNGTASPAGSAATAFFDYGLTTGYGNSTPVQA